MSDTWQKPHNNRDEDKLRAEYSFDYGISRPNRLASRMPETKCAPEAKMRRFAAVIERDADMGVYVGWVPGFPGAHSQGETLDELRRNLQEVVEMLLEDGDPRLESKFIGTQTVEVA